MERYKNPKFTYKDYYTSEFYKDVVRELQERVMSLNIQGASKCGK